VAHEEMLITARSDIAIFFIGLLRLGLV